MSIEHQAWERYYRFLEIISEDLVAMALYWRIEDESIDVSGDPTWPELRMRLHYADHFLYHSELTKEGISPHGEMCEIPFTDWKYALVYDCGTANNLITRSGAEESFRVSKAYYKSYYINWGVKFFDTVEEVKKFITDNPLYEHYSLYKGLNKITEEIL